MKYLFVVISFISLAGCGTIGGAMLGAGEDLGRAGNYVKGVGNKL